MVTRLMELQLWLHYVTTEQLYIALYYYGASLYTQLLAQNRR